MSKREGPIIFKGIEKYAGLKKALEIEQEGLLKEIKNSNLKGRGGAGFPTGLKWELVSKEHEEFKFVVCNADEGEPGTFKDRVLITEYASLIFESMVIAGYAVGAQKGFFYLRGEYKSMVSALNKELEQMKQDKALGNGIMGSKGFNFDIEVKLGSGAYVCGEETALIESLEGNRGEPRNRPPFPVDTGYYCYPTSVNNVETLCNVPHILVNGADWFKSIGTKDSAGAKLLSISGDCEKPGVYEVPFGITISEVLDIVGAKKTKAVQVGGASGICIGKDDFDRKLGYEDLSTGGSIIIFNKDRNLLDAAINFLEFFKEESCGQCTPCREGVPVLLEGAKNIKNNKCDEKYLNSLLSLSESMQIASKCGLGQTAPKAFVSIIDNFADEYNLFKTNKKEKKFRG
ncbi:NADH-quinone oxidoreductase subunit F [bacterium]